MLLLKMRESAMFYLDTQKSGRVFVFFFFFLIGMQPGSFFDCSFMTPFSAHIPYSP